MRGIVWSQLVQILIVIFVVIIMGMVFQSAFSQGESVLNSAFEWFSQVSGVGFSDRPVDLALSSSGSDLKATFTFARVRDIDIDILIETRGSSILQMTIGQDEDVESIEELISLTHPAQSITFSAMESGGSGAVLLHREAIVVDPRRFTDGTARDIVDDLFEGLTADLSLEDEAAQSRAKAELSRRLSRVENMVLSSCDMSSECPGGPIPVEGFAQGAIDHCYAPLKDEDSGEKCVRMKASLAVWLYCLQVTEYIIPDGTDSAMNLLSAEISSSGTACTVQDAVDQQTGLGGSCYEDPLERRVTCAEGVGWRII